MIMEDNYQPYKHILNKYREEFRYREIPPEPEESHIIDFTSNDYLGLGKNRRNYIHLLNIEDASCAFSSSASRLLSMKQNAHNQLEELLEACYNRSALLFNSGYHANLGCIKALNLPGTLFLADKLVHASIIDGLILSGAEFIRWRHNDIDHLETLIEKHREKVERLIIVAESIYSMDGDTPDLKSIIRLKRKYGNILLYIDEAHAFGVRGKKGLGISEELGIMSDTDIIVGTLGKAAASAGAFVITDSILKEYFINTARSFIFSTALPPINITWSHNMVRIITGMENERRYLQEISEEFSNFITGITGEKNPSSSQIIPMRIGNAEKAVVIAAGLREEGIYALPIRRPTVPPGGERLRFSLNANLSREDMEKAKRVIRAVYGA